MRTTKRCVALRCRIARDKETPKNARIWNTRDGRELLFTELRALADRGAEAKIVVAYEASPLGFGLYDECIDAGIKCYILAPTKMPKAVRDRKRKNDERDALRIFEMLRGHVLAGNDLPGIWIPDDHTQDDRETLRARLDSLQLRRGVQNCLSSLLRQLKSFQTEIKTLDGEIYRLSQQPRYKEPAEALVVKITGVGLLTAVVYLTEMGDLSRFRNRTQIGSFLGLVPSSKDSGESDDHKGFATSAAFTDTMIRKGIYPDVKEKPHLWSESGRRGGRVSLQNHRINRRFALV